MKKLFRLISPSYMRSNTCVTHKYLPEVEYCVDPRETYNYASTHDRIITLPEGVQGSYPRVCNWILDNVKATNIIIIDDDMRHFGRWKGGERKKLSTAEAMEFIEQACRMAEQMDVHYWGMNILPDKGCYHEHRPFSLSNYLGGPFQAHRGNECRYDEKMLLKEDYDMTLQVLNKYRKALRFNMYHFVCSQHTNNGGCAAYRTMNKEKEQNEALRRKWGSKIVKWDSGATAVNRVKEQSYDINPMISPPIGGI